MKITRIETIPIRVPIKAEFAIRGGRGGAHTVSPFLLVKVHTDEGFVGLGEASCTPRWSGEDQVTGAHLIRTYLEPLLAGEELREVDRVSAKFRLAFAGNYFTRAAVEMALWDLAGKAADKPVYELLGDMPRSAGFQPAYAGRDGSRVGANTGTLSRREAGAPAREQVPTKWSVSGVEPDKAAGIARWAVARGFNAMKVKVGLEPAVDVARVKAVREAIGPKIKLGVDANGGWSLQAAEQVIPQLYDLGIYFVEQPLPPEAITEMAELRRRLRVPLVADESVYTLQDAKVLALLGAADVFSIYVGKAGGLGPAREIARFAESRGLKCTLGSNLELGVGSAAMTHLALACRGIAAEEFPCDIIGPFFYEDDIVQPSGIVASGKAVPSRRPGLGVELDEGKVARYRVKPH